jgi:hypothetical protein
MIRLYGNGDVLNTGEESIIELINQISLKIRILNSAHVVKTLHLYQPLACMRLKVSRDANNRDRNVRIRNLSDKFLLV